MGQQQSKRDTKIGSTDTGGLSAKVALGAGCYWGTEKYIRQNFQKKFPNSIKSTTVGFMSPEPEKAVKNPTYEMVCSGRSGYVEVLYVELENPQRHYKELIKFFFQFHDPTTRNRQGNDVGSQYASYIFTYDEEQDKVSREVIQELQVFIDTGKITRFVNKQVVTKVCPASKFHPAHRAHQNYLAKHPIGGYCNHFIRFKEWPVNDIGSKSGVELPQKNPNKGTGETE